MQNEELEELRFPIGRFEATVPTAAEVAEGIERIAGVPRALRAAVDGLDDERLDTPYRPEGWTVRQVVHHVVDSHLNGVCRFKLALTEDEPTIRPYFEDRWARLADYALPVGSALDLLDALHARWCAVLASLGPAELERTFIHPEWSAPLRVDTNVMLYAWHGEHHVAHITSLRARRGW